MRLQMKSKLAVLAAILTLVSVGCGKKDEDSDELPPDSAVQLSPSLLRVSSTTTSLIPKRNFHMLTADSEYLTTDVNILSFKYPIASISISESDGTTTASGANSFAAYTCDKTTVDGCMVELTGNALENLLVNAKGVTAKVGTFNAVSIGMCPEGVNASDTYFTLKAEVMISGVQYYTHATSGLSIDGPAVDIKIPNKGGCGSVSYLPDPLVITADGLEPHKDVTMTATEPVDTTTGKIKGDVKVNLYFDLTQAALASGGITNTGAGVPTNNCLAESAQKPYICVNFPKVIGTLDSKSPTVTRMVLNNDTIWAFYKGTSAVPFGAYQRSYRDAKIYTGAVETTFMGPDFKKPVLNTDGTYTIETYNDGRYMKASAFKLENHSGKIDKTGTMVDYTAVKLN